MRKINTKLLAILVFFYLLSFMSGSVLAVGISTAGKIDNSSMSGSIQNSSTSGFGVGAMSGMINTTTPGGFNSSNAPGVSASEVSGTVENSSMSGAEIGPVSGLINSDILNSTSTTTGAVENSSPSGEVQNSSTSGAIENSSMPGELNTNP